MWHKPEEAKPSPKAPPKPETIAAPAPPASVVSAPVTLQPEPPAAAMPMAASAATPVTRSPASADTSPSQISAGLKIRGDITGTSDLLIDGDVQGKIQLMGCKLTIGPSGRVKSDIEAREINVFGMISGNLKAAESVALGNTGQVEGSVITRRISIDDGARLRGKVEMIRADGAFPAKTAVSASARAAAKEKS